MKPTRTFRPLAGALLVIAALTLPASTANALPLPITYVVILDGPSESPVNASPGTGFATVVFDLVAHTMDVNVSFSGLIGTTTASHIHAPTAVAGAGTAGVATQLPRFVGFPVGVTSGTYSNIFDMTLASSYNPAYVSANGGTPTTAETALAQAAADGKAYLNIHTSAFGGGEIRGFLTPAVPEPASLVLFGTGIVGLGARRWRRRR